MLVRDGRVSRYILSTWAGIKTETMRDSMRESVSHTARERDTRWK